MHIAQHAAPNWPAALAVHAVGRRWAVPSAMRHSSQPTTSNLDLVEARATARRRALADDVPSLKDFMRMQRSAGAERGGAAPAVGQGDPQPQVDAVRGLQFHVETYGCQMNTADSEIVTAVLTGAGLVAAADEKSADVVLLNTCAIRENAENRIWERLRNLRGQRETSGVAIGYVECSGSGVEGKRLRRRTCFCSQVT